MNDKGDPTPNSGAAAPTPEERQALVWAVQAHALRHPDKLVANLGVLGGDVLHLAHILGDALARADFRASTPAAREQQERLVDKTLRVQRHADRMVRLWRELGGDAGGAAQPS